MRPGARMKAAVEVLGDIFDRHKPAATALTDWGKAHRFAGSGDRAAIGNLVYDALRHRQSLAAQMGSDTARALVLGAAQRAFGMTAEAVAAAADGSPHALEPLSPDEAAALQAAPATDLPAHVAGDFPEWLTPSLTRVFGAGAADEGRAMAERAPIDLRVNTLKATREKVLKALAHAGAIETPHSPIGVRIPAPQGSQRAPHVEAEAAHGKGWFEVQDEGSQIAAQLAGAKPRQQVLDLCAGAGGKTLALSAIMQNTGQIYAYDRSRGQLRPIFDRLKRAGARNVQVMNGGDEAALDVLGARFDLVLVDASCTGSGTWRRRPDSKWRLKPQNIVERQEEQRAALAQAARYTKPGGQLVYVTCSILPEENSDQIDWFMAQHDGWTIVPWRERWQSAFGGEPPLSADGSEATLLLTPARHGTDGFFVAILQRSA
jgi:16S rRNA (cytosine967-C5)-methyltransferase